MKKFLALILALLMMLSITACNSETPVATGSANLESPLLSLSYDDSVWTYYEDSSTVEDDYCSFLLQIPDPEDPEYYLIEAELSVSLEEPYDFREDLVYYGFDQYEYKVNNSYALEEIGSVEVLKYEEAGEKVRYFNRIEGAGATVVFDIDGADSTDERVATLLAGITVSVEDTGNVDGPWEWEGEKFSADDHTVTAGSLSIDSKWIEIDEYISTFETFNHAVAATDDAVFILTDGVLKQYAYDGTKLTYEKDIELPEDDYECIQADKDGALWLSGSMNDVIKLENGAVTATYEDVDTLYIHPTGEWGISYFVSNECQKVTFSGSSVSSQAMTFSEVDTVMSINVDEDYIYVCGSAVDESGHKVFVYDTDGKLKYTLADSAGEGLGSVTFVAKSGDGFIGFDGNMRDVLFWKPDGSFVAEVSCDEMFGTYYPWFCSSTLLSDGSILTIMTEERADKSATELVAYHVSGF